MVDLLVNDTELLGYIRSIAVQRISNRGKDRNRAQCQSIVDAAVDETLQALKVVEMLQFTRANTKAKKLKSSYGRIGDSKNGPQSDTLRGLLKGSRGGKSNSDVIPNLMKTIRPSSKTGSIDSGPIALRQSVPLLKVTEAITKIRMAASVDNPIPKRSKGRTKRSACNVDIIQNIGKADAELDAKILSSPQLKDIMSRSRFVGFEPDRGSGPFHASILEEDDHFNMDDLLNFNVHKSKSSKKMSTNKNMGIVNKAIDFGKRQRFKTAFPDFEQNSEFETVDEWLKAREEFKGMAQNGTTSAPLHENQSPLTEKAPDDFALNELVVADPGVDRGNAVEAVDGNRMKSVLKPKLSEEPEIRSLSQCGPGVYIGSDFVLEIESRSTRHEQTSTTAQDESQYTENFEDDTDKDFSARHGRKKVSFAPLVVTHTHHHRTKYSPEEISSLFYTHDEAHQFSADYSYEIYRAESLGVTWEAWWEARSQEDVDREEEDERIRQELIRSQNLDEREIEIEEVEEEIEDFT